MLDLSYLYEVSGNDPKYVYDIILLFLENVPDQIIKLEKLVNSDADLLVIQKQAHSLKSSVLFVKIRGLFDCFYGIEMLARQEIQNIQQKGSDRERETATRADMRVFIAKILKTYEEVTPLLQAETEKNDPLKATTA